MTAEIKRCILDGRTRSRQAILARIARELEVSPARIRNLDALYDVLSTDVPGPIEIVWHGSPAARSRIPAELHEVFEVLREVARERADLTLRLDPPAQNSGRAPEP